MEQAKLEKLIDKALDDINRTTTGAECIDIMTLFAAEVDAAARAEERERIRAIAVSQGWDGTLLIDATSAEIRAGWEDGRE